MSKRELYEQIVKATQEIAKEKGIFWEEEQSEIAEEMLRRYTIDDGKLRGI